MKTVTLYPASAGVPRPPGTFGWLHWLLALCLACALALVTSSVRAQVNPGSITTFAGNGTKGFSGDGGPATTAQLYFPSGIAIDSAGNLYIADKANRRIRKVDVHGTITTFAGSGIRGFDGDGGPATTARLDAPNGVAVDGAGNLYIADTANRRIRKVDARGTITTIAGSGTYGSGGDGGPATAAQLNGPSGMAFDGAGNLYIADTGNSRIRKVDARGTITTIAGNGNYGFSGDGGPATAAQLNGPSGMAFDGAGNLYIADRFNHRIRKVDVHGTITTFAGSDIRGFDGDGGPATAAQLDAPNGVAVDMTGNLYIGDQYNHRIRKVDTSGTITTFAGNGNWGFSGDGGPATAAQLDSPEGVAVDGAGNLYIVDYFNHRIRRVLSNVPGVTSYPITTSANPVSGGTVVCSPNPVAHGSNATCTATPAQGYTFTGFSGDCTGSTCNLSNVTSPKSVTANFTAAATTTRLVTLSKSGSGTGSVTSSPAGLSCTANCSGASASFPSTSAITLTAQPTSGSTFAGWSGACTGTASCAIAAGTSTANVTASFTTNGGGGGPLPDPVAFVTQQYQDFLRRAPDNASLTDWVNQLNAGTISRDQLIYTLMNSGESQGRFGPIMRLYSAYFLRLPDYDGLMYWFNTMYPSVGAGAGLAQVSNAFASSAEFVSRYGALNNEAFVTLVYQNVLGRDPEPDGFQYWVAQLRGGMSRGQMMIGFSESAENQSITANGQRITLVYVAMLGRAPTASEHAQWLAEVNAGRASLVSLIAAVLNSAEYAARF